MDKVYFDSNASTKMHPEVIKAMIPFYDKIYGNASSVHSFGREAKKHLEEARSSVAKLINAASPDEIIFTSGGTESDNFAIKGVQAALKDKGNHIITSQVEHHAVLNSCKYLEKQGVKVTYLGVDKYGLIDLDELADRIKDDTILVTIMAANNETGTIMPIKEIADITSEKGILFHSDSVQYAGKVPFDVQEVGLNLASLSAHKIYGPKGVGALYVKKGTKIVHYQHGGSHERNLRSGTENVAGIVGFAKACEIAIEQGDENRKKLLKLRDMLYNRVNESVRQIRLNGHPEKTASKYCKH